mmetsp:Transcript_9271/g.20028  ORF Transcript_9271/g.20028 Transcript_9271/m.20028 type:complete len:380 (-) Transcript_9271:229-1368(-)
MIIKHISQQGCAICSGISLDPKRGGHGLKNATNLFQFAIAINFRIGRKDFPRRGFGQTNFAGSIFQSFVHTPLRGAFEQSARVGIVRKGRGDGRVGLRGPPHAHAFSHRHRVLDGLNVTERIVFNHEKAGQIGGVGRHHEQSPKGNAKCDESRGCGLRIKFKLSGVGRGVLPEGFDGIDFSRIAPGIEVFQHVMEQGCGKDRDNGHDPHGSIKWFGPTPGIKFIFSVVLGFGDHDDGCIVPLFGESSSGPQSLAASHPPIGRQVVQIGGPEQQIQKRSIAGPVAVRDGTVGIAPLAVGSGANFVQQSGHQSGEFFVETDNRAAVAVVVELHKLAFHERRPNRNTGQSLIEGQVAVDDLLRSTAQIVAKRGSGTIHNNNI